MRDGALGHCFATNEWITPNVAGRDSARLCLKGRTVWKIAQVIHVPEHSVNQERYILEPPHPFGPISAMFLREATSAEIEAQEQADVLAAAE